MPVVSTSLASVGYSRLQACLEIEFCDGCVYQFFQVPHDRFLQLLTADSKGTVFNQNIRNRYSYQQLALPETLSK